MQEENSTITDEQLDAMIKNLTETDESSTIKELKQKHNYILLNKSKKTKL